MNETSFLRHNLDYPHQRYRPRQVTQRPANCYWRDFVNVTERLIGLDYKIRAKTMRGLNKGDKVLGHCYLSEYLREVDGVYDLRKVV